MLMWSIRLLFLIIFMMFTTLVKSQNKIFQAGASISNITPPLGEIIAGGWNPSPASYIHDQLNARSLVLYDGNETLVFVVVDNVGVKQEVFDAAKSIILNQIGIPASNILMSSTHTHSGVSAAGEGIKRRGWQFGNPLDEYQRFVAKRIADGVQTAIGNLESARIASGTVDVPEHVFNRRWIMKESVDNPLGFKDLARMNPGVGNPDMIRPAGPTDPEVTFIAVESIEGKPISLLGNYSLHYVGGVPHGQISADYFAVFGDRIQELLKADRQDPPFVGIMTNGTSGDINNINWPGPRGESNPPYAKMRYVANDVAEKVMGEYKNLQFQVWVPLKAAKSELTLQVRRASPEVLRNMEKVRDRPEAAEPIFHPREKVYAQRIRLLEQEWPDSIDIILQTFKIGNLGIAAIPFEPFAEIGLELKDKSPFEDTFTIELANGSFGYLPTPAQHDIGGYETWLSTNKVQKDASRKIVTEILSLFEQLDDKMSNK